MNKLISLVAWANAVLCIGLSAFTMLLYRANLSGTIVQRGYAPPPYAMVIAISFPLVGALILSRKPVHAIGWLFFGIGLGTIIEQFATQYAIYTLFTQPGSLPFGPFLYNIHSYIWLPNFCLIMLLLMLFPTGRAYSRRWSSFAWLAVAAILAGVLAAIAYTLFNPPLAYFDPSQVSSQSKIGNFFFGIAAGLTLISTLAAVIILILRLRRSSGVERQQLKWFVFAGSLFIFIFIILVIDDGKTQFLVNLGSYLLLPLSTAGLSAAVAIAILRYRLYDIDIIIRRTLIYALLSAALVVVYFGSVILFQSVLRSVTGESNQLAIVASTLLIAALFNPLRNRVQNFIDRRFYRRKYDAEQTLAEFSARIRNKVDLDELSSTLVVVVQETMQPESISLWLRK